MRPARAHKGAPISCQRMATTAGVLSTDDACSPGALEKALQISRPLAKPAFIEVAARVSGLNFRCATSALNCDLRKRSCEPSSLFSEPLSSEKRG